MNSYEMTGEDVEAASHALFAWMQSQDINSHDAARVLTTCLVAIIHQVAVSIGRRPKDGGRIITDIIMEALP